jgi:hypothetical protein
MAGDTDMNSHETYCQSTGSKRPAYGIVAGKRGRSAGPVPH